MIEENGRIYHYIYLITNKVNGKTYIGQKSCPRNVLPENDISYMGSGKLIKYALNKYGVENFNKDILAICDNLVTSNILEIEYIKLYRGIGKAEYNISDGGNGGYLGEEVANKMKETIRKHWLSPEGEITRQKIREARAEQVFTPEQEEKRREGVRRFWDSEEGLKLRKINSERAKGRPSNSKGKHWYHRGTENVLAFECPPGFEPGKYTTYKPSEETKRKHSSWIKSLTPEELAAYKVKLSESHKGIVFTEERCRHISEAKKGKPGRKQSEETREKISETLKGRNKKHEE